MNIATVETFAGDNEKVLQLVNETLRDRLAAEFNIPDEPSDDDVACLAELFKRTTLLRRYLQEENPELLARIRELVGPAILGEAAEGQLIGQERIDLMNALGVKVPASALINVVYPTVSVIGSTECLKKSSTAYPPQWMVREIVQNFADANPKDRSTLNGVALTEEAIDEGERRRFTIRGNWPFKKSTGLTGFHSDKADNKGDAGGNGMGLKQTALILMRDYGVTHFSVQGEGWTVNYRFVTPEEINPQLPKSLKASLEETWLIAEVEKTQNTGTCAYVIETADTKAAAALRDFHQIGVSDQNKHLQDMDYCSEKGALKWLSVKSSDQTDSKKGPQADQGRLFINGQVMHFKTCGKTPATYWDGPDGITLQFNGLDYEMSADRPPVSASDLQFKYIKHLIESMSKEDLMSQLEKSEHLWVRMKDVETYDSARPTCLVVVEAIADRLKWYHKDYAKAEYESRFGDRKYVCADETFKRKNATAQQKVKEVMRREGFTICPGYFEGIGMPTISSITDSVEWMKYDIPDSNRVNAGLMEFSATYGLPVDYEVFRKMTLTGFIQKILTRLSMHALSIEMSEGAGVGIMRIQLRKGPDSKLLYDRLSKASSDEEILMRFLRGIIFFGLRTGLIKNACLFQGEYLATFNVNESTLLQRNRKAHAGDKAFIEFEIDTRAHTAFEAHLQANPFQSIEPTAKESPVKPVRSAGIVIADADADVAPEPTINSFDALLNGGELEFGSAAEAEDPLETAFDKLRATLETDADKPSAIHAAYDQWRRKKPVVARENSSAKGVGVLRTLVAKRNVGVEPKTAAHQSKEARLRKELESLLALADSHAEAEDFEIVETPNPKQERQLESMRIYYEAITGHALTSDLFIFKGKGALGISLRGSSGTAIGIHEAMFDVDFAQALGTFLHEVAHGNENAKGHDDEFISTLEAVGVALAERFADLAEKLLRGEGLTDTEQCILKARNRWNQENEGQQTSQELAEPTSDRKTLLQRLRIRLSSLSSA